MTEVRAKDKLFLAVVVPVAAIAAYWYFWRAETAKKVDSLSARSAQLVKAEDFDFEKMRAERELKQAEEELAAEKKVPMPVAKVKADARSSAAEREREVLEIFRTAGLRVSGSERIADGPAAAILRATGTRPAPVSRVYRIEGRYPQMRAALDEFVRRESAVIVEKVEMGESDRERWTLEVTL